MDHDGTTARPRGPGRLATGIAKRALNLRLEPEVVRRLKFHAIAENRTISDLVTQLVIDHLPDYQPIQEGA